MVRSVGVLPEPLKGAWDFAQDTVFDGVEGGVAGQLAVGKRLLLHGLADFKLAEHIAVAVTQGEDQAGFLQTCFFSDRVGA